MDCYTGICARTYVEHSILCKGHPGKPPTSCQESLSYEGGQGYYTQICQISVKQKYIPTPRYGTNKQKSKALHRGYSKSNQIPPTLCLKSFLHFTFNHVPEKSTSLRCFVLGYLLQSGTHVSRQLKRKQEKYNSDRQRNQSFACHAKSLARVKDKIERYFQPKTDNEVCCVKGMNIHPLQNLTLKKIFIQQCAPVTYLSAAPAENLDVLHASNRIYCTLFHNF